MPEGGSMAECCGDLLAELDQSMHEDEISECVFQALICAYLDHDGWQQVAEAVFAKAGYTPQEIREHNAWRPEDG